MRTVPRRRAAVFIAMSPRLDGGPRWQSGASAVVGHEHESAARNVNSVAGGRRTPTDDGWEGGVKAAHHLNPGVARRVRQGEELRLRARSRPGDEGAGDIPHRRCRLPVCTVYTD